MLIQTLISPGEGFKTSLNAFVQSFIDLVSKEHKSNLTDFIDDTIKLKGIASSEKVTSVFIVCRVCKP